jgi:hypothetical protein
MTAWSFFAASLRMGQQYEMECTREAGWTKRHLSANLLPRMAKLTDPVLNPASLPPVTVPEKKKKPGKSRRARPFTAGDWGPPIPAAADFKGIERFEMLARRVRAARAFVEALLKGSRWVLVTTTKEVDRYSRSLSDVFLGDVFMKPEPATESMAGAKRSEILRSAKQPFRVAQDDPSGRAKNSPRGHLNALLVEKGFAELV